MPKNEFFVAAFALKVFPGRLTWFSSFTWNPLRCPSFLSSLDRDEREYPSHLL